MAQPHKGDRQQVACRISRAEFNKLNQYVELVGTTKTDLLRELLLDWLDQVDVEGSHEDQQQLPISA